MYISIKMENSLLNGGGFIVGEDADIHGTGLGFAHSTGVRKF